MFKVITESIVVTEYYINAETEDDAVENLWAGNFESVQETDYRDEELIDVEEMVIDDD